jgi:hypothetical protein
VLYLFETGIFQTAAIAISSINAVAKFASAQLIVVGSRILELRRKFSHLLLATLLAEGELQMAVHSIFKLKRNS